MCYLNNYILTIIQLGILYNICICIYTRN